MKKNKNITISDTEKEVLEGTKKMILWIIIIKSAYLGAGIDLDELPKEMMMKKISNAIDNKKIKNLLHSIYSTAQLSPQIFFGRIMTILKIGGKRYFLNDKGVKELITENTEINQ